MAGFHGVLAAALSTGAQVSGVAEHLCQRHEGVDLLCAGAHLVALDLSAAGVDIADDIAHILVGHDDADFHDGLQQRGIGLAHGLLEGHGAGDLKRHFGGVHLVVGAVEQRDLHVHDGIARHDTGQHGALNTGIDGRNILLGNGAAHHGVDKFVALAGLVGLHMDLHVTILALTAGLTGILGILVHCLADGLLVGHLGRAHVGLHLELPQQAVHDDLQMQLAHTGDDGLTRLLVGVGAEGGVLLGKLGQGDGHLFLAGLGLGLDGHADHRLGELHGLQDNGILLIAQRVAGGGVLQTHHGGDVAGVDGLDVLAVIGVHLQDAAHTLALALGGIEDGGARGQRTGVHAEKAQTAHIGVGHDLKGQRGEGLVVGRLALLLLVGPGVDGPQTITFSDKDAPEKYYVYGHGEIQGVYTKAGDAIKKANDYNGVLVDSSQDYVWERGNRNLQYSITEKDDVLNTIKDRLKNQEKPIDILKDINDGAAYDLTGCTTEEILYIINQGRPVIAMLDSQNAVILVGYSDTNVVYEDLNDSTRHSVKYEEMDQMTSGSGNAYIG